MIYQASFTKHRTYWWDEDKGGECRFAASSDEEAKQFISTVVLRMNRHYEKMKEPRDVSVMSLSCLEENGFSLPTASEEGRGASGSFAS